MRLAVFSTYAASRKEPLAESVTRIRDAFLAAGIGEPQARFLLHDPPDLAAAQPAVAALGVKRISSVDRILKRWPQLQTFAREVAAGPSSGVARRMIANVDGSGAVEPIDFAILEEIALGVPRSFPCHAVTFHFSAARFCDGPEPPPFASAESFRQLARAGVDIGAFQPMLPGVIVRDSWWVNGRNRSLSSLRIAEAAVTAKKLPPPPEDVGAVLAAFGKARKAVQIPIAEAPAPATSESGDLMRAAIRAHHVRIRELLREMPHALANEREETATGPKKPELVRAFGPMGFDCRGESGAFTLRRRTASNLTIELYVDVGTWSNQALAFLHVRGMTNGAAFKATLPLPLSPLASFTASSERLQVGQFPIGGPERWRKIVDNLHFLVEALQRRFVPEIEAIAGPSPAWFEP